MNNNIKTGVVYTILHLLVDFTTVFLVCGLLIGPEIGIVNRGEVIITYNLIAFAGQLPIGMIADMLRRNRLLVAIGCALSAIAYPVAFIYPWIGCILASLANGVFHIGAGAEILKISMPKAAMSGLFVSSGAFGVWLAYNVSGKFVIWLCPVVMVVAGCLLLFFDKDTEDNDISDRLTFGKPDFIILLAVSCFMLTIVIRSLLGMVMDFSWKAVPVLSLLSVLAVVSGKAIGGYLGDRFGYIKTAVISLGISLLCFAFSFDYWIWGIIAVLCFNMTMPLTLTAIAGVSNKKYGFAFGLTTFALAIGFVPVVFGAKDWFGIPLLLGGSFLSMLLLVCGFLLLKKQNN